MEKKQIKRRWTAYGRHLVKNLHGTLEPTTETENPLDIREELNNIKMGDGTKGPFGIPISTGVAVTLIKNMLEALEKAGHGLFGLIDKKDNKDSGSDIIKQLILNSMGVTFDKSQILRIISQPKCEGVRFYHALRKNKKGEDDSVTLVLVGVDKNGFDLNYKGKKFNSRTGRQNNTCESLVDDWGHPPGSGIFDLVTKDKGKNPRYVLLRMAEPK
jgi:hypothetical protein